MRFVYPNDPPKWYVYTYKDITKPNMVNRCTSEAVEEYIAEQDPVIKANKRKNLRYTFLNGSVARWWDYVSGPWPLQVQHGTADNTVMVENSRWLAEQMRLHNVETSSEKFEYLESFGAGHKIEELNLTYRQMAAQLLEDVLS